MRTGTMHTNTEAWDLLQFPDFYRQCLMRIWITFMCYIHPSGHTMIPFDLSLSFARSFVHLLVRFSKHTHTHSPTTKRKLMQSYLFDIGSDYSSLANVIYCVILFDVYCKIAFLMPFGTFCVVVQLRIFSANLSQFRESDFQIKFHSIMPPI